MERTTADQVGGSSGIVELDDSTDDLSPFIATANELVTELCTGDNGPTTEYSAARLELIERWLAAHFYSIHKMRKANEKVGPLSRSFQHKVNVGLAVTMYGQQAMALDTNGQLAQLDKQIREGGKVVAKMVWLGTTDELEEGTY